MNFDDATGEPLNICNVCQKEFIGWIEPYRVVICDECREEVLEDDN